MLIKCFNMLLFHAFLVCFSGWFILHDISEPGPRVWRRCGHMFFPCQHLCCRSIYIRSHRDFIGKRQININQNGIFCFSNEYTLLINLKLDSFNQILFQLKTKKCGVKMYCYKNVMTNDKNKILLYYCNYCKSLTGHHHS